MSKNSAESLGRVIEDRLTIRHGSMAVIKDKDRIKEVMERLAQYEETGLMPEEVVRLNTFVGSQIEHLLKCLAEERAKHEWIPANEPPRTGDYILLSFENFSGLLIGRYEEGKEGGTYYLGDCDGKDSCLANDLYVNAWMALPKPYEE